MIEFLVAVLVDVDGSKTLESEQKVAKSSAQYDAQAQPCVIGHKDQHEQITNRDLKHVKERLNYVTTA